MVCNTTQEEARRERIAAATAKVMVEPAPSEPVKVVPQPVEPTVLEPRPKPETVAFTPPVPPPGLSAAVAPVPAHPHPVDEEPVESEPIEAEEEAYDSEGSTKTEDELVADAEFDYSQRFKVGRGDFRVEITELSVVGSRCSLHHFLLTS